MKINEYQEFRETLMGLMGSPLVWEAKKQLMESTFLDCEYCLDQFSLSFFSEKLKENTSHFLNGWFKTFKNQKPVAEKCCEESLNQQMQRLQPYLLPEEWINVYFSKDEVMLEVEDTTNLTPTKEDFRNFDELERYIKESYEDRYLTRQNRLERELKQLKQDRKRETIE